MNVYLIILATGALSIFCTGLGVLPFIFIRKPSRTLLGWSNAAAAGMMLAISIGLSHESITFGLVQAIIGIGLGILLIHFIQTSLEKYKDWQFGEIEGQNALKVLLFIGVMTAHSFAEGLAVGVSFGNDSDFGLLVAVTLALHKFPEGLAIALIMIPRGASLWQTARWSMFTSLALAPMAVLAYFLVTVFDAFLAMGLGLAAGAMIWMVFKELLPEARTVLPRFTAYSLMCIALIFVLGIQWLLA